MFNTNFTPLAGVLGLGYFMHPCVIPIIRKNRVHENNERDLSIAYFLVFLVYLTIGVTGYYGFMGSDFNNYALTADPLNWPIAQNCIIMFNNTDIIPFIIRLVILTLTISSFPILNNLITSLVVKMCREHYKNRDGEIYLNEDEIDDE